MKRLLLLAVSLTAIAALVPGATLGDTVPAGGSDYAVGGGTETYQARTLHFAFSAHQNSPNPPTGYVVLDNLAPPPLFTGGQDKIEGPVQCLAVVGNIADIIFTVKKTNSTDFAVGQQIDWKVVDNGNPNQTVTDAAGWDFASPAAVQAVCNGTLSGLGGGGAVTQGNVRVQDPVAALLPCPSMTDDTTYLIDTSCNLYTMQNGTWTLAG
jgi:hypothetical protein